MDKVVAGTQLSLPLSHHHGGVAGFVERASITIRILLMIISTNYMEGFHGALNHRDNLAAHLREP